MDDRVRTPDMRHRNQHTTDVPPSDPRQYAVRLAPGVKFRIRLQGSLEAARRRRDELGDGAVVVVYDQFRGVWNLVNEEDK